MSNMSLNITKFQIKMRSKNLMKKKVPWNCRLTNDALYYLQEHVITNGNSQIP